MSFVTHRAANLSQMRPMGVAIGELRRYGSVRQGFIPAMAEHTPVIFDTLALSRETLSMTAATGNLFFRMGCIEIGRRGPGEEDFLVQFNLGNRWFA